MADLDPKKLGAAIADVQVEIAKREFVIQTLDDSIDEQRRWITFLEEVRLPALNAHLDNALAASTSKDTD